MRVAVLGSTGCIGQLTLEVLKNKKEYTITALIAYSDYASLRKQAKYYPDAYHALISEDNSCIYKAVDLADIIVVATNGITALPAIIYALKNNKKVAIANKESLIVGGQLINDELNRGHGELYPIDSEHSAIWQCLRCGKKDEVKNIILTASGGALRNKSAEEINNITPEMALSHPTWKMGKKVTIDSASLMNKGFEAIEAYYLFGRKPQIVIHPESIIHSMVEFNDGAIIAQMAMPDMKLPIMYALGYPNRKECGIDSLDFFKIKQLNFFEPDYERFPCLKLALSVFDMGLNHAIALNGADSVAVEAFLNKKIAFNDIYKIVNATINESANKPYKYSNNNSIEEIMISDRECANFALSLINK